MNSRQKWILFGGAVLVALMLLFPPWDYFDPDTSGRRPAGYHFFLTPPAARQAAEVFSKPRFPHLVRVRLNDLRFAFQLGTVIPIWLGLIAAFHRHRSIVSVGLAIVLIVLGSFVFVFAAWLIINYGLETGHWELL